MNVDMPRAITSDEIANYHRDGVVMLPGMFDREWVDLLKQGLDANCDDPTDRSRVWDRDAAGRTMFYDSQAWQRIEEYRQFIYRSPAAQIAGQLMGSARVNFYFDAVFVRSPGCRFATPWHQDEPYWSVE
jgi:ectoine hydroxylase-related dioxygenase (phytanoyl-CoA dioxygenase family)